LVVKNKTGTIMITTKEEFNKEFKKIEELLIDNIVFYNNTYILIDCSDTLTNNKEIVLKAIKQNHSNIDFIGEHLRNDEAFMSSLMKHVNIFSLVRNSSANLKNSKSFAKKCIEINAMILDEFSFDVRNDPEIVFLAASKNIMILHYVSDIKDELVLFFKLLEHYLAKIDINNQEQLKRLRDGLLLIPSGKVLLEHFSLETVNAITPFLDKELLTQKEIIDTVNMSKIGEEINNLTKKAQNKTELFSQYQANEALLAKLSTGEINVPTNSLFKRKLFNV
jgi:hypothetical protein